MVSRVIWGRCLTMAAILLGAMACQPVDSTDANSALSKIDFDLNQLDEAGLYGPPDGKRSLDYEFCLPRDDSKASEAQAIDPSLTLYSNMPGRIGCTEEQYLAIGNSHQPNSQLILQELANLDYIDRIEPVYWE